MMHRKRVEKIFTPGLSEKAGERFEGIVELAAKMYPDGFLEDIGIQRICHTPKDGARLGIAFLDDAAISLSLGEAGGSIGMRSQTNRETGVVESGYDRASVHHEIGHHFERWLDTERWEDINERAGLSFFGDSWKNEAPHDATPFRYGLKNMQEDIAVTFSFFMQAPGQRTENPFLNEKLDLIEKALAQKDPRFSKEWIARLRDMQLAFHAAFFTHARPALDDFSSNDLASITDTFWDGPAEKAFADFLSEAYFSALRYHLESLPASGYIAAAQKAQTAFAEESSPPAGRFVAWAKGFAQPRFR